MPAAAVIPAPIAYIKVVAVKKLVVEFLGGPAVRCCFMAVCTCVCPFIFVECVLVGISLFAVRVNLCIDYCEQIRVFKAGLLA